MLKKNISSKKQLLLHKYKNNILSIIPEQIYCMNEEGRIIACNEQQAKVFGFASSKELIGKNIYDVANKLGWDKSISDKIHTNDLLVMRNKQTIIKEEIISINGEDRIFLVHKKPIVDDTGNTIGITGISIDMTDKKRAEEYRLKHEAAQKVINFSNLVAGSIAHELKNPLAGIKMQMETLRSIDVHKIPSKDVNALLEDMTVSIIKTIDATTYVIDGMLKKVRTFATGGVHHKEFEEISIVDDVEHLLSMYPFNDDQQNLVKVIYGTRFKYLGDKVLTAHVLSNLMKNALHAIGETSKGNANITIETKSNTDFNLLIFKDTATGIPKDFLGKIFDQFETKKDVYGGTGLGLAFCKSVMDSYKGSITCSSEDGQYTEFVLSFPKIN